METPYEAQVNLTKKIRALPAEFETQTGAPKDRDTIESLLERLEDHFHSF